MLFGLDGVEIGLLIVFLTLFSGILTGFPVAFAIAGSAVISFAIIALLDANGLLIHQAIDTSSAAYRELTASGIRPDTISIFRYPDLPRIGEHVFPQGWETALDRNLGFIVNRINERVLAGASIETLLAVLMFVMMSVLVAPLSRLARVPKTWLMPCIIVFSMIGAYAVSNRPFDIWVMFGFGLLGFVMNQARVPLGPFIIGFILAPLAESKLRAGLMTSDGDWSPLWTEPLPAFLLLASALLLFWPAISAVRRRRASR
mgnify:CR=1 FL=1